MYVACFSFHIVCQIEAMDSSWLSCFLSEVKKCSSLTAHNLLRLFTAKLVYGCKLNKQHCLTHGHYSYLAGPGFLTEKASLKNYLRCSIFLGIKKVLCFRSPVGQKVQEISRWVSIKPIYSMPKTVTKLLLCKQLNINIMRWENKDLIYYYMYKYSNRIWLIDYYCYIKIMVEWFLVYRKSF